LGIAAESPRDATSTSGLGDRVIVEAAEWADGQLDDVRAWRGIAEEAYLDVHHATRVAKSRGLPVYGHFRDGPGVLDAQLMRAVLALFADEDAPPAVVVISRDTDEDEERQLGFVQARAEEEWPFAAILASAHPEHEAWLLVAFEPGNEAERNALAEARRDLGFDPTRHPHELKAGHEGAKRNAKRVLALLCESADAEERFTVAPLDTLREHGLTCGLTAFLTAFRAAIGPHLGAGPA
jgi:hypothetical protein